MRCVPRRRRTPHAAAGDHHLEEEEEGGAIGAGSQVRRERKEIETAAIQTPTRSGEALFKVARGASVARRINIVPEQVKQVDEMLIPRSNGDLFH